MSVLYPQIMNVIEFTKSQSDTGGEKRVSSTKIANANCRLRRINSRDTVVTQRQGFEVTHRLYCETSHDIDTDDEITVSGVVGQFRIVHIYEPYDGFNAHHKEIDLELYG